MVKADTVASQSLETLVLFMLLLCHPPPENNIISQRLGLSTARQPPLSHPSLKLEVQIIYSRASQVVLVVKNVPANEGDKRDASSIPRLEDPLE